MIIAPFLVGLPPSSTISTISQVPPLWIHPRDFSSSVERPPILFPGVGCPVRQSCPALARCSSYSLQIVMTFLLSSGVAALRARTCSAPTYSIVSLIIEDAPKSTKRSLTMPITGLDANPEVASDPPHSMPIIRLAMSQGCRVCIEASCANRRTTRVGFSMVLTVPCSS